MSTFQQETLPGFTIWLTGLSASGKSTLALHLERYLASRQREVEVLDGDVVRSYLCGDLGFSREDRNLNIKRITFVCSLLARHGVICITSAISPYREARDRARRDLNRFVEVYVRCPIEMCRVRDPKGLYALVDQGRLSNFTGVDDPYEEPLHPEIVVETATSTIETCVAQIIAGITLAGYLEPDLPVDAVCN